MNNPTSSSITETTTVQVPVVPVAMSAPARASGKIMIVDDEVANVLVARKLLERAGYTSFETTTDSSLAMNILYQTKPDVLLLDINMPEVDGIQILSQIRSIDEFRHLPVLILTANTESDVKLKCLELGATDFLVKPVDPMDCLLYTSPSPRDRG